MILLFIGTAFLVAILVTYFRQINSRFKKYGVKYDHPVPVLGNSTQMLLRLVHVGDSVVDLYNKYPEERFVGRFDCTNEVVFIRDLDLVKNIGVKDFEYFLDHRSIFSESSSVFAKNLFSLKGQDWKDMRASLSPAFTSSKMRAMLPFMVEVGDQMTKMLKKKIGESKTGYLYVNCKDLTTRYASDVIASCAFGLKVDSHTDPENEFYVRGKNFSVFDFWQMITFFIMINMPKLAKFLKVDWPSKQSQKFFSTLILETMKEREEKQIIRPDMIHLLMEAKKGKLKYETGKTDAKGAGYATAEESAIGKTESTKVWTDQDLIAQAMIFFIAGFETVSDSMCFLLYELAVNPDVQDRLAKEIKEHAIRNNYKFDFNSIQEMTYLDMVVSEVLRLWPPATSLDRLCVKDYNLGKPNKNSKHDFIIREGTTVVIPAFAFHRDPKYFPNPKKFDPERFSEENKHKITPFVYMPFGIGPRNCNGSRFALCEMKVMTYQILLYNELLPSETTRIPAELAPGSNNNRLKGGITLKFKLRD